MRLDACTLEGFHERSISHFKGNEAIDSNAEMH